MTSILAFPKQEPQYYTRLSLRKYNRTPGSQPELRLTRSIRLPMPTSLHDSYNIDIANPAFELLGNSPTDMLGAGKDKLQQYEAELKNGSMSVSRMIQEAAQVAALAPGISDTGVGKFAQSVTGMVRNPHLTTVFEGVRPKTYQFAWKLSPRSQEEAQSLNEIIRTIKTQMHPMVIGGGFAMEYPDIASLWFEGPPSVLMPNVRDSFITRLDINSSGTGTPAFFRDGQPVTVELNLAFQEIDILTRNELMGIFVDPSAVGGNTPINDVRTNRGGVGDH